MVKKIDSKKTEQQEQQVAEKEVDHKEFDESKKTMVDVFKAVQKHDMEVAKNTIHKFVEAMKQKLMENDIELLESLNDYLKPLEEKVMEMIKDEYKDDAKKMTKVMKTKKAKDSKAKGRLLSPYNLFVQARMAELKQENEESTDRMGSAVKDWKANKAAITKKFEQLKSEQASKFENLEKEEADKLGGEIMMKAIHNMFKHDHEKVDDDDAGKKNSSKQKKSGK